MVGKWVDERVVTLVAWSVGGMAAVMVVDWVVMMVCQ